MEKDFVPYEEALVLKELGFDEPYVPYARVRLNLFQHPRVPVVVSAWVKQVAPRSSDEPHERSVWLQTAWDVHVVYFIEDYTVPADP